MRHFFSGHDSRYTNPRRKGSLRALTGVESLEGRRLMTTGVSASLTATAQADIQLTSSQEIAISASYTFSSDSIVGEEQKALLSLKATEQGLDVVIGREALMIQQSAKAGVSAAVALHAVAMAQAQGDLARIQATEVAVVNASVAAEARVQYDMDVALAVEAQASTNAKLELAAAAKRATNDADALHAEVMQGVTVASQFATQGQADAGSTVQGIAVTVGATQAQVTKDLTTVAQLDAGAQAALGAGASLGSMGTSTSSH